MKKRILIACTMQVDAIRYAMKKQGVQLPVVWLPRKLHNQPGELHDRMQQAIDAHQDMDEILLSYGLCGNATLGLVSGSTKLILPRCGDCISQLLAGAGGEIQKGCFYLTREWTADREAIVQQCEWIYRQYGETDGQELIDVMYAGYHTLVPLADGAYDVDSLNDYVDKAAKYTGMRVKKQAGSTRLLEELLGGVYSKNCMVRNAGEKVALRNYYGE